MATFDGTDQDDLLHITRRTPVVFGRRGDDYFIFESGDKVKVDGGFGHDIFEFQLMMGETFTVGETENDRTVVKIFEDGLQVHKIILFDVEELAMYQIG